MIKNVFDSQYNKEQFYKRYAYIIYNIYKYIYELFNNPSIHLEKYTHTYNFSKI